MSCVHLLVIVAAPGWLDLCHLEFLGFWLHVSVFVAVVDYDAMRDAAAETATKQATTVRMLVSKLGRAQQAAEATLDLCDT
jgi:hypothetical protein